MNKDLIRSKEFLAGGVYVISGIAFIIGASGYQIGDLNRMGPGLLPMVLAVILTVIGIACMVRAALRDGATSNRIAWRPIGFVVGGTVLFGIFIPLLGLPLSLVLLMLTGSFASTKFVPNWKFFGWAAVISIGCVLLFIYGLGLPIPLLGTLFK